MRVALNGFLLLLSTPTLAADSPLSLSGVYGTENACELFTTGGLESVYSLNGEGVDYLLVSQALVLGQEWECRPQSADGTQVSMTCYAGGDEGFPVLATIHEDAANGTLAYSDEDAGARTLNRCN